MIKKLLILALCGLTVFCLASCSNNTASEPEKINLPAGPVFDTENVVRITFYAYYGGGKGSEVPAENMAEIKEWLDSFAFDRVATDDDVLAGTNTRCVEIEYTNGTVVKEGLDVILIGDTRYLLKKDQYPDCFLDIISKTSLK